MCQKQNHRNNKETYIDGSKSEGRKVDFAVIFIEWTTVETNALPKEASLHAAEMTTF